MVITIDRMELADIAQPVQLAKAVLSQLGTATFPIPVEAIALGSGITEICEHETDSFEGMLLTDEAKDRGAIIVRRSDSPARPRFTIAHELGHFFNPWHRPSGDGFRCTKSDMTERDVKSERAQVRVEAEANRFATELLMPVGEFRKRMGKAGPDLERLQHLTVDFGVSKLAAARRIVELSEQCALVVSHLDRIEYVVRSDSAPFLLVGKGQALPPDSISKRYTGGQLSALDDVEPCTWLKSAPRDGAVLYEQVLVQLAGRKLTLLVYDTSECDDEEDEEINARARFEPRFR